MLSDVKKYVGSCAICQFTKPSQRKPGGFMVPICPQYPWEYAGVDFVGPLPRTPSGNAYILVFVDYFSKWIEVCAVREATALVAYLISDRGSVFMSDLFKHTVSALGTEHRLTTAYHPQTNATERVNRTLKTAIRAYVGTKHTSWDRFLPHICFALRTAQHDSTGLSPSMVLYGRELDTPLDLLSQPDVFGVEDPGVTSLDALKHLLQEASDHVRSFLEASHSKKKHYYDKRHRLVSFSINDLVRVKTHPRSDSSTNFAAKLAPLYTGPYRVAQKLSDVNYRLADVTTGKDMGVFHVVNMEPFLKNCHVCWYFSSCTTGFLFEGSIYNYSCMELFMSCIFTVLLAEDSQFVPGGTL
uniref:Integrase catalytic domain-containing protein n=1 Tax=Sinocyclocheilus anshuiensis TaxID=1608454 RepID=A0A671PBD1_9TELE